MNGVREVRKMANYSVLSKVSVPGTIVEKVENEELGIRYKIKIKANDKFEYLWFEEDEVGSSSENVATNPDSTTADSTDPVNPTNPDPTNP